ncbi:MAG TPA: PP2C family protein-serine/threonine phosphatase [Thermoanaerobaculia bacterium]|nr:PP2C family protein-serine/threonine phosphatase [Thermoanaerobaculia bacterium]
MKRFLPFVAAAAGVVALMLVLPLYKPAQPKGIAVTRGQARAIADRAARQIGIPVDSTFATIVWWSSPILEKELQKHPRRADAWDDPVLGPRLDAYRITYYHRGKDKYPPYGNVAIDGRTGEVVAARLRLRAEDTGGNPTEAQLRARADAFVHSRTFPGSPSPQFESARPNVLRGRTDWVFRYRVPMTFPLKNVVSYLNVNFVGSRFAGWDVAEEYADGRQFFGESGSEIGVMLAAFAVMFVMLLLLLVIFLRKYHAGEVGVGSATFLFAVLLVLAIAASLMIRVSASEGTGMGSLDAEMTSWVTMAFKLLFADIPLAVVLFLAWAVGESYARERWGERLAAFEAILRRDPFNATVGRSLLQGALFAPAVAAAGLVIGAIPLLLGYAWANWDSSAPVLYSGGPYYAIVKSASTAALVTIGAVLFVLAWTHRRRVFWLGIIASVALGVIAGTTSPPIDPTFVRMLFGFGGIAVVIAVFLGYDLLAAATSLFGATSLVLIAPLMSVARGDLLQQLTIALSAPLVVIVGYALIAMLTRREVVYTYEDLAPHVKRIIERERVKAEIDAANRIQAALLPIEAPNLAGTSVSSHYRAATEIGGDYFDFLQQPTGEIGIAFGDVSGHGLTSGIVMAMAKSALLVQIDYDSSPRAVLDVLNDIVIRTAPKRIMMTFFFGLLDPRSQTLRFSSAGHLDPYVFRASTRKLEPLSSWGFPLGVRRREPFREHSVQFSAGDRLILYSDGLIEAIDDDGDPFGFQRFEEAIVANGHLSAEEIKKSLLHAVRKFTRNRPPEDDQTLVVVAFEEFAADQVRGERTLIAMAETETVH